MGRQRGEGPAEGPDAAFEDVPSAYRIVEVERAETAGERGKESARERGPGNSAGRERALEALPALVTSAMFSRSRGPPGRRPTACNACAGAGEQARAKEARKRAAEKQAVGEARPYVVWSSDFHIGPIADLKASQSRLGLRASRMGQAALGPGKTWSWISRLQTCASAGEWAPSRRFFRESTRRLSQSSGMSRCGSSVATLHALNGMIADRLGHRTDCRCHV